MKNLWISLKITLAMCIVLGVGYVLVLRGVSAVAGPNGGEADVVTLDGQVVGAANVGQRFTDVRYFWSRPSAVDYNGGGSGGSNKATTNPEHLAGIPGRCGAARAGFPRGASLPLPRRGAFGNGDSQRFGPRSRHLAPRGAGAGAPRSRGPRAGHRYGTASGRLADPKTVAGAFRHGEGQCAAPERRFGRTERKLIANHENR